jgi:alpha-L-arabinofuranosidase
MSIARLTGVVSLVVVGSMLLACQVVAAAAEPATITVQVDKPGIKISPMLYGLFFEEINRAGDGGIYAEMVQNRSFEDAADKPVAWSLVKPEGAEATMALDTAGPLNDKNPHWLRLEVAGTGAGGGKVGVANDGFKGMAVRKATGYALSLYARVVKDAPGPLAVALEGPDGKVLASGKIEGLTGEWKKFDCVLTATDDCPTGRLVLAPAGSGTVGLDMVSLFPKQTWLGRPNGLRADLAEMLAAMKPAFIRFPGGCFVEGNKLANAFRWKDTIGDVATRPGHLNLWGYRSTDGLGFHEYLQMCEDLKAEPLFVINCGMAHEDVVPMDKMNEWVQDALDAIEYANGPAESPWGAKRAQAGHPAPFNLKYMEIGNENGGPKYQERYDLFYAAIKAKYPQMNLVADELTKGKPTEIVDEHYYNSPEFFSGNAAKYDKYKREGPKVYVGEYAVTQNCGKGNLRAALGEAAFMTGMERNSDVVVMASYAPLFVNVGWRQWNPDAICFDSGRCFGTPSYHVQAMFARNRGDVVLPTECVCPAVEADPRGGAIGVGTWSTQAEYKDIKVTRGDKVLFETDFADGLKGWRTYNGKWEAKDGVLRQEGDKTDVRAIIGDKSWDDYTYALKARKLGGAEGFLILFSVRNDNAKSWWNLGGWGNVRHAVEMGGVSGESVPGKIETGRWYDIKIELKGSNIRCYLDGKLIHDLTAPRMQALYAVAGRDAAAGEVVLKVVNVAAAAQPTRIDLRGAGDVAKAATCVVLTSADGDGDAENTLEAPTKVAPATSTIDNAGATFEHTFPAHSVTILRLKATGP